LSLHIRTDGIFYLKMIKSKFDKCKNELLI
jgi:hypothetical protein